jgi:hypothetical protein
MGDRDGSPSLPGASATTGRTRTGTERSDLHRQAMRRSFGFKSDQPEEAPEEPVLLTRHAASLGKQATRKKIGPRRAAEAKRNPSSDWDPRAEATPELVSQDRGAGDLRVTKADEHRRILRSAQMGAGSNAGPHFFTQPPADIPETFGCWIVPTSRGPCHTSTMMASFIERTSVIAWSSSAASIRSSAQSDPPLA